MAKRDYKLNDNIENHPIRILATVFGAGFGIAFIGLQLYYSNRIDDIKNSNQDKLDQQIKNCENQINLKIIEVQNQERDKYYMKIEENSMNGKLLEKTLELIEKRRKDEK